MKNSKEKFRKKISLIIFLVLLFFTIRIYIDNFTYDTTFYNISIIENENNKFLNLKNKKIIFLSDLHNEKFYWPNTDLIMSIKRENPDYILLGGDMVSAEDTDFSNFFELVDGIKDYKTFYIQGNHEQGLSNEDNEKIKNYLINNNVYYLNNSSIEIDGIVFYGLNYGTQYYIKNEYTVEQMKKDLGEPNVSKLTILLAHNPDDFLTYKDWGADLVFSGHTHGGMVRIFDIGIISTDRTLLPQFDGGVYKYDNKVMELKENIEIKDSALMFVSRGLSRGHVGFRLFNQPESIVLNFN